MAPPAHMRAPTSWFGACLLRNGGGSRPGVAGDNSSGALRVAGQLARPLEFGPVGPMNAVRPQRLEQGEDFATPEEDVRPAYRAPAGEHRALDAPDRHVAQV